MALPFTEDLFTRLLSRVLEVSEDSGTATGGSQTTLEDTTKNWEVDRWSDGDIHIIKDGVEYVRSISTNTATVNTFAALPAGVEVAAGDPYSIRRITIPQVISERAITKAIKIYAPSAVGTFWLPETGHIDLSKLLTSTWAIYAPTTATMVINCYLNISHDGGTTLRRAAGYEILDADFVRDAWNTIDCPLKLAETKLEVVVGTAHPAALDLMCIAKP